jgi:hypothetical protein
MSGFVAPPTYWQRDALKDLCLYRLILQVVSGYEPTPPRVPMTPAHYRRQRDEYLNAIKTIIKLQDQWLESTKSA